MSKEKKAEALLKIQGHKIIEEYSNQKNVEVFKNTKKKRLVLVGDSLGMPRPEEDLHYDQTYPYLLRSKLKDWEIIQRNKRANDTTIQTRKDSLKDDILYLSPNIVTIQLGIVDCAPRLFGRYTGIMIDFLPNLIKKVIIKSASKNRKKITKRFPKTYVPKEKYRKNIEKIVEIIQKMGAKPILIEICDTTEEKKKRSHNFEKNIKDYNTILKEIATEKDIHLIELFNKGEAIILSDGIHLNKKGNEFLTNKILETIPKLS